jgi:hypothetical protein
MKVASNPEGRKRAWVLVRVEEEKAVHVAQDIFALNENEELKDANNFVVRADVATGPYNIVVPVDVGEEVLSKVIGMIAETAGVIEESVIAVVERHVPYPPHDAYGYVTEREAKDSTKHPDLAPGPRGMSPGENPWG